MAITASDILYKFSTTAGSAGNSNTGTGAGSLGKFISTSQITTATLHELFDVVTGDESTAGDTEYRCMFVHNAHASLTWTGVVVWLPSEVSGGAAIALSVDTTAASAIGAGTDQAKTIANESTAPSSQTFSSPTSKGTGLAVGDLAPGQCRAVWVRRTVAASTTTPVANDGGTVRFEGDTL